MQTDNKVIIHDTPWELHDGGASGTKRISDYMDFALMYTIFGVVDGNDFLFNNTMRERDYGPAGAPPKKTPTLLNMIQKQEAKLLSYKFSLASAYNSYKVEHEVFSRIYNLSYEGQESLYNQKIDNSKWVTFKPSETGSYREESAKIKK